MPSWLPNTVDHGMPLQRRRGILTPRSHRTGMTRSTFLALRKRSQRVMMTAWFNLTAAWFNSTVASGGAGGGGRWWRRRHAPRGGRSGTRSRCSWPTSSTRTPWHRSTGGTTTGRACRCACPTAPPCASSSSSCSGLTAASPTRSASSGYSCSCGRHHHHVHP